MSRVTRADWAASVPAEGIIGQIPNSKMGVTDIGQLTANGFANGKIPVWNSSLKRFIPGSITPPTPPPTPSGGDAIFPFNSPGVATRFRANGPNQPFMDGWYQEIFDIRQYGAFGDGMTDDSQAINQAIYELNNAGAGCLYIPQGNFFCGLAINEITGACSVVGQGRGVSKITVQNDGLRGGAGGQWFEAAGISLISDGTSGSGISISDGTNAGDLFSFHDLDLIGFSTGISVAAAGRSGFINGCRIEPWAVGLNLNCQGATVSDCILINAGPNTAVAAILNGNYNQLHGLKLLSGSARWAKAIEVQSGTGVSIADSLVIGTEAEMISLSDGSNAGPEVCRVQNISFSDVQGDPPVVFTPSLHYVNELQGLGSNANTSFDLRKELAGSATWNPPSLRPLESAYFDLRLVGVKAGDQVALGAPDNTDYLQRSASAVGDDIVRITITNMSVNTVDLPSATYHVRVFN